MLNEAIDQIERATEGMPSAANHGSAAPSVFRLGHPGAARPSPPHLQNINTYQGTSADVTPPCQDLTMPIEAINQAEKATAATHSTANRSTAPAADSRQSPGAAGQAHHTRETSTPIKKERLMSHPYGRISSC